MKIIRVWLYKATQEPVGGMDVLSKQFKLATRVVRGDFKYYKVDSNTVSDSCRREADDYAKRMGQPVELFLGYPDFMFDLGYRV